MNFKLKLNEQLIIFGTGSQASYVIDNLDLNKESKKNLSFVNLENNNMDFQHLSGFKIFNDIKVANSYAQKKSSYSIVAHGNLSLKLDILRQIDKVNFINAIHENTSISKSVSIGCGNIINSGAIILPNVVIGSHCIIHSGCVIEHDCQINDSSNIAPGVILAGGVVIGKNTYIYTGAKIGPKITIGDNCIIGAGSLVLNDIPSGVKAFGSPAKIVEKF